MRSQNKAVFKIKVTSNALKQRFKNTLGTRKKKTFSDTGSFNSKIVKSEVFRPHCISVLQTK